jgi:hypothetical protein
MYTNLPPLGTEIGMWRFRKVLKDLAGSATGLMNVLSRYLPGETEEKNENTSQGNGCPGI